MEARTGSVLDVTGDAERKAVTNDYAHIINELSAELEQVTAESDQLLGNVRSITAGAQPPGQDPRRGRP
jgi:hypothetical protein